VRGTEVWSKGINEFTFVMKVRGYPTGTSVIVGVAPDTIAMDSQYPGYSRGFGVGVGDQGSNFGDGYTPTTTYKKPSGRFFDEGDEVRIVYDADKQTLTYHNNKVEMCSFTGVSGQMCPVISLYGNSVCEWVD